MPMIRAAVLSVLLLSSAAHAGSGNRTRYVDLTNRAHDSVTTLEFSPTESNAFREIPLKQSLGGGGDSTTIGLEGEGCLYDLRLGFRNGRTLIYKALDACKGSRLTIRPLPRRERELVGREQLAPRYVDARIP